MRKRVLLLAEVANPEMVSVPLVGWSLSEALAGKVDVHLVTHIRNRDPIKRQGWVEGRDFTIIDMEKLSLRILRIAALFGARDNKGWTILQAFAPIGCYAFERAVWKRFRPALEAGEYDIVHRVTPVSPTTPSILGPRLKRLGIPLVVGPLNGGVPWPTGFEDRQMKEREWLAHVRDLFKLLPGYHSMRRDAAALIAGSLYTLEELPGSARPRSFYLPENGIDPTRFGKLRTRRATQPMHGAFLGRLVPYKSADVLLRASAELMRAGKLRLSIIGDGPERPMLDALIEELGVGDSVTMHGAVEHRHVQDLLVECDFLACPSIREFGGGVVLEAMALGVAPIVADYGGQTELVDEESGIRVPFTDVADLTEGFRHVLEAVVADPARLDAIGEAAARRVRDHFTWERKAAQIEMIYDWAIAGGPKPEPVAPTCSADRRKPARDGQPAVRPDWAGGVPATKLSPQA